MTEQSTLLAWLLAGPCVRLERATFGWALELRGEKWPRIVVTNEGEVARKAKVERVPVIGRDEWMSLCRGAEFDRVHARDMARLIGVIAKGRGLPWADVVDGAHGIAAAHALDEWTLERAVARMGLTIISARVVESFTAVEMPADFRKAAGL